MTLDLVWCLYLAALPARLGECAALTTLNLSGYRGLLRHLGVTGRLNARGCDLLLGAGGDSIDGEDEIIFEEYGEDEDDDGFRTHFEDSTSSLFETPLPPTIM